MALFSKRERIAIALISTLILSGWAIKLTVNRSREADTVRVIRNAVNLPASLSKQDTLSFDPSDLFAPLNINSAKISELELLPMIGPVKAAAIIEFRKQHGPYKGISDIMKVPGIGQATFEKIRKQITIGSDNELKER